MHVKLAEFTVEEIALSFINALKSQGLEDAAEQQLEYDFVDNEYPDDEVRVRIVAAPHAPNEHLTRANVMNILYALPLQLLNENYLAGVRFYEQYQSTLLYTGIFNNKNNLRTLGLANQTRSNSVTATSKKRSSNAQFLSVSQTNSTTTVFTVPGANEQMELTFQFVGVRISKIAIFNAILPLMFGIGLEDSSKEVPLSEISLAYMPAWIFMRTQPESEYRFAVFHALAILEAIARYYAQQGLWRELVYDFTVDGVLVNSGCITKPDNHRQWCRGLRGEGLQGIHEGQFTSYS